MHPPPIAPAETDSAMPPWRRRASLAMHSTLPPTFQSFFEVGAPLPASGFDPEVRCLSPLDSVDRPVACECTTADLSDQVHDSGPRGPSRPRRRLARHGFLVGKERVKLARSRRRLEAPDCVPRGTGPACSHPPCNCPARSSRVRRHGVETERTLSALMISWPEHRASTRESTRLHGRPQPFSRWPTGQARACRHSGRQRRAPLRSGGHRAWFGPLTADGFRQMTLRSACFSRKPRASTSSTRT